VQQAAIEGIAHPTDFSEASAEAFAHALRLALAFRCRLDLLHVRFPGHAEWASFPHVRETLERWGFSDANAAGSEAPEKPAIEVRHVEIESASPLEGVAEFLLSHRPGLVVMATHGASGLSRLISGSVSEGIAQRTRLPAMFFGPKARPFVDAKTGRLHLKNALVPVAAEPSPKRALLLLRHLFGTLGLKQRYVHVGDAPFALAGPAGEPLDVGILQGPVVEAILSAANTFLADLVVMPTAGHHGFLDALRGSTTEQVLHRALCPVLALPA
jgi:nucleotide-binding universal stress UspA family protein